MRTAVGIVLLVVLLAVAPLNQVVAKDNGIYNNSGGCNCHGYSSVTAQLNGVPTDYTPGTSYTLTVGMGTSPNTGGFNLEVNKGQLSNPDANSKVNANGRQATHDYAPGTTSWTMDWTAPVAGSGAVRFDLAVLSANGNGATSGDTFGTTSTTANEGVSNQAPSINNLAIAPNAPTTLADLTASYTFLDDDGDTESGSTVAWYRNGVVQPSHTALTLPASATSKGESWHVEVTPSDGMDAGTTEASAPVIVVNSAPSVVVVTPSSVTPDTTVDVTFSLQSEDVDGDAVTTTEARWHLEGSPVQSLDNATTLPSFATRPGDVWSVEVRVSDGTDLSGWLMSDPITVGSSNEAPVVSEVQLGNGTVPLTGDSILATWTESDPDGDAVQSVELTWSRDGVGVSAADGLNPLPSSMTAKGEAWSVQVRAYDGNLWSAWTTSQTLVIGNTAPAIDDARLVSTSLTVQDNLTLNLTGSDVDGDDLAITSVRWFLNDVEQGIAVDETVLPASALSRGDAWHAVVRISDGIEEVGSSTETLIVVNSVPRVEVAWSENVTSLADLSPNIVAVDADGDDLTTMTTWYKNGFRDATLSNLTSVPKEKLAPEQGWRLRVTVSDGIAWSEVADVDVVIGNLPPLPVIEVLSREVWLGERTVLSSDGSTDLDGTHLVHRWTWNGQTATGSQVGMTLDGPTEVTLRVTDEHGASATTSLSLTPEVGPQIQGLEARHDGSGMVRLTWSWSGDTATHHVYRNGNMIAAVNATDFTDRPPMSGANTYTVQPVNEERTFQRGADDVSVLVEDVQVEAPEPAAGLGYGLGGAMLFVLLLLQLLTLRHGGGRQ